MKILVVSSTDTSQAGNVAAVSEAFPGAEQAAFLDPLLAIKHNVSWNADAVLCEFALRIIDGIQLVKLLRQQNQRILPILIVPLGEKSRDADNLAICHTNEANPKAILQIWSRECLE
ncbi:MAG: hypothetical protein PHI98_11995 [Eubacteriales bacterium]|nr:hypothetical protein [Eubacteriales bacterium]